MDHSLERLDELAAKLDAWERLKEHFWWHCPDTQNWIIDNENMVLSTVDKYGNIVGVSSEVFTFWRNRNAESVE